MTGEECCRLEAVHLVVYQVFHTSSLTPVDQDDHCVTENLIIDFDLNVKGVEKISNLAVSIRSKFREKQSFKN